MVLIGLLGVGSFVVAYLGFRLCEYAITHDDKFTPVNYVSLGVTGTMLVVFGVCGVAASLSIILRSL